LCKLLKEIQNWKRKMKKYPNLVRKQEVGLLTAIFRFTRSNELKKESKRKNINLLNDRVASMKTNFG